MSEERESLSLTMAEVAKAVQDRFRVLITKATNTAAKFLIFPPIKCEEKEGSVLTEIIYCVNCIKKKRY